jgi:hypothetical protein
MYGLLNPINWPLLLSDPIPERLVLLVCSLLQCMALGDRAGPDRSPAVAGGPAVGTGSPRIPSEIA